MPAPPQPSPDATDPGAGDLFGSGDPFVAMVRKTAQVSLPLGEYQPRSWLRVAEHDVARPRFPVVDAHCHLDSEPLDAVLRAMDEAGVERIVNISLARGAALDAVMTKFRAVPPERVRTFVLADWRPVAQGAAAAGVAAMVAELRRRVEQGARGLKVWKDLGLTARDAEGRRLRADDARWAPIFDEAARLGVPVMLHLGDPAAFFAPPDRFNERYEELAAHPEWSFHGGDYPAWEDLWEQQERLIARHPRTRFIGAHMAGASEDLARVAGLLDRRPNLCVDISARAAELGRQPRTARAFFLRYPERILFGSDLPPAAEMYRLYYRFLETEDEYFPYPTHGSGQGRWRIYGLGLPDEVLERAYRQNALEQLGW